MSARIQFSNAIRLTTALLSGVICLALLPQAVRAQTLDRLRACVRNSDSKKEKPKEPEEKEKHPEEHWAWPSRSRRTIFAGVNGPFAAQNYFGNYTPLPAGQLPLVPPAEPSTSPFPDQLPLVPQSDPDTPPIDIESNDAVESHNRSPGLIESFQPSFSRLSIEGGTNFKRLSRIGIRGRLERQRILGLDGSGYQFYEHRKSGGMDALSLGDINMTGRLITDSVMRVRAGVGANWLNDRFDTNLGISLTASAELFMTDHWYSEFEFDAGKLGKAELLHMRIQTGYDWKLAELFIGYDHYSIGSAKLNGLVSGVGIRL